MSKVNHLKNPEQHHLSGDQFYYHLKNNSLKINSKRKKRAWQTTKSRFRGENFIENIDLGFSFDLGSYIYIYQKTSEFVDFHYILFADE